MNRLDSLDVVVRRKNGLFFAMIPQFNLVAKGSDPAAAIDALEAKKQAFLADLEEVGEVAVLEVENQKTATRPPKGQNLGDLSRFALKTGIVAAIFVLFVVISGHLISQKVHETVDTVKGIKVGGAQMWTKIERELDRMASPTTDLPEEKKQKLLADIRAIVTKWRPFIVAAQSAMADDNASQASPKPAKE